MYIMHMYHKFAVADRDNSTASGCMYGKCIVGPVVILLLKKLKDVYLGTQQPFNE